MTKPDYTNVGTGITVEHIDDAFVVHLLSFDVPQLMTNIMDECREKWGDGYLVKDEAGYRWCAD